MACRNVLRVVEVVARADVPSPIEGMGAQPQMEEVVSNEWHRNS